MHHGRFVAMTLPDPGGWPAALVGLASVVGGGFLWLRSWLSRNGVDRAGDTATLRIISLLRTELDRSNTRNEALVHALDEAHTQIGALRTQVALLSTQVSDLQAQINKLTGGG